MHSGGYSAWVNWRVGNIGAIGGKRAHNGHHNIDHVTTFVWSPFGFQSLSVFCRHASSPHHTTHVVRRTSLSYLQSLSAPPAIQLSSALAPRRYSL